MSDSSKPHRVVIIGGGFAGLYAAIRLRRTNAQVTLIDRRNFHLFQPLLYQVATGGLSPANIASPLRSVLRKQTNTEVMLAEVVDFDLSQRKLIFRDEHLPPLEYDSLIVATGSEFNYFGHDNWQPLGRGSNGWKTRRRFAAACSMPSSVRSLKPMTSDSVLCSPSSWSAAVRPELS